MSAGNLTSGSVRADNCRPAIALTQLAEVAVPGGENDNTVLSVH